VVRMKVVVTLCAVGLAGAAVACARQDARAAARPEAPTVAVAPVTRGDLSQVLTIAAEFRAYQEIDLHAKVAGYVRNINVDVGDHVKDGQLLAVLEVPELLNDEQQDQASITRASEEVNRAQADLQRAESAHDLAHLSAARLEAAAKERPKLIAQQDLDDVSGRDRESEAQVATAKAAVAAAGGQLAFAKANADKTRTLVGYTRITAPFTGVITRRYADKGAMIQAGTSSQTQTMPLVRLSQVDRLRLDIAVPESAVPDIKLQTPVAVRVPVMHRAFPGTVARFADRLDSDTRTMLVEVDVPNPTGELKPGMVAEANMSLEQARGVLSVPVQALDPTAKPPIVMVVTRDHTIDPRPVTVGLQTADRVAVTGAIGEGDLVVVGAHDQLHRGEAVKPKQLKPEGEK
jgi:RND family efflux transporter MFP subunit